MILTNLKFTNDSISNLINLTSMDIEDIKQAKHKAIHSRSFEKSELVEKFEKAKANLDIELVKKMGDDTSFDNVLTTLENQLLEDLKENLKNLQSKNKHFAKLVISVNEFYNSMTNEMFPNKTGEMHTAYGPNSLAPARLLEVSV